MFTGMFKVKLNVKRSVSLFSFIILFSLLTVVFSSSILAESNLPLRLSPENTAIGLPPRESEDSFTGGNLAGDDLAGDDLVMDNELINSLTKVLQPLFKSLSLVLGGIFGVYLIMVICRLYYEHKKVKLLKDILYDLDKLNEHYKINNSRSRVGLVKKIIFKFKKWFIKVGSKK